MNITDPTVATGSMYLVDGCTAYVKIGCQGEAFTIAAPEGMSATKQDDTDIYEIKITDRTKLNGSTAQITATNDEDNTRQSSLTVTLQNAAVSVTLTPALYVEESKEGDNIVYTIDFDNLTNTGILFTVTAPLGATTDLSALDATWLRKTVGETTINAGTPMNYTLKSGEDDTQTGDITLTFTNAQQGGNQTIVFKRKASAF